MGDMAAGEKGRRDVLAAAEDAGTMQYQVFALRQLAGVLLYQHRADEAAVALDRALALSEMSGELWNRSELLGMRARAALLLGEMEAADSFVSRALSSLRANDVTATSEVYYHLGGIRAAQGRNSEAEAAQRRSLEAIAQTDYNRQKTEPTLALARLVAERGALTEAAALLDERERWAHEHEIPIWDAEIDEIRSLIAVRGGA
jgi:ATP/maltotriose-dependent transcriptional regulator MalT